MTAQAPSTSSQAPVLVVFGLDGTGKAHASCFAENDVALAKKAAALMGMNLLPVRTDAERALAAKLPKGRVFASGRGFVPFVKAALYAELKAAAPQGTATTDPLQTEPPASDTGEPSPVIPLPADAATSPGRDGRPSVPQPTGWGDIQVGAIVLSAAATDEGWYECEVLSLEDKDYLRLQYCDFPSEPVFTAQRSQIGLMNPAYTPELPPPLEAEPPLPAD